jgi:hypothetical protein
MNDKHLQGPSELDFLGDPLPSIDSALPGRLNADPENLERGLAQLVLTIVELLRQIMERQAVRRMDDGSLSDEQVERLGQTFMALSERMAELREQFGLDEEDLNLNLGPLGDLL